MNSVQYYNENANDFISTTVNNIEFKEISYVSDKTTLLEEIL